MKYAITKKPGFSLATLTKSQAKTVVTYISCDIHRSQSVLGKATELLYPDLLLSGAGRYNRAEFLDAISALGATISPDISEGIFTLVIRSKADVHKKILALVSVMLASPSFKKSEIERTKKIVTNLLNESKEDTSNIAHKQLRNAFYGVSDRRYSFNETQLIDAVRKVTAKDLTKLHTRITSCDWTVSTAANSASVKELEICLNKLTKSARTKDQDFGIHQQMPPAPKAVLYDVPGKQNIDFSIGVPVPITLHHPDYLALVFGLAVLGKWGGFAGRLMSTVREQEGLTYGIYAKTETFLSEEQGYWRIMTFFAPEKAVLGLTSTFREIKNIFEQGITKNELLMFKQILATGEALKNDSTSRLLGDLHSYHLQNFSLVEIKEHKAKLAKLTLEDVNTAIRLYLNPAELTISGAGPVAKMRGDIEVFRKTVS